MKTLSCSCPLISFKSHAKHVDGLREANNIIITISLDTKDMKAIPVERLLTPNI